MGWFTVRGWLAVRGRTTEGLCWLLEGAILSSRESGGKLSLMRGKVMAAGFAELLGRPRLLQKTDRKRKMGWKTLVEPAVLLKTMEQGYDSNNPEKRPLGWPVCSLVLTQTISSI